jgi:ribosomal protein S18 acetylase RimI-like enzyme
VQHHQVPLRASTRGSAIPLGSRGSSAFAVRSATQTLTRHRDGGEPRGQTAAVIEIRGARPGDDAALVAIDDLTWTSETSPGLPPEPPREFFAPDRQPVEDVLVAELDGVVAGYAIVRNTIALPSHAHVLELGGLAVHPDAAGHGVGTALVETAVAEAVRRGARKMSLRVLGGNAVARRLYARCGFDVEGVLKEEFLLDGRYVDDVLMARQLAAAAERD